MIIKFKIYEKQFLKNLFPDFKNEKKMKSLLLADEDFSKGDVHQGIINIAYEEYKHNTYDEFLSKIEEKYGQLTYFCILLSNYNAQVCNGGHLQYFDNRYASSGTKLFGKNRNIDIHDDFVKLFKELEFDEILPLGEKAYDVISNFDIDYFRDEDDEEYDINDDPLNKLDDKWYDINEKLMEQFNDYLKRLTLDNNKISDLIEIAKQSKKFNI